MFDKLRDKCNVIDVLHSVKVKEYAAANGDFRKRRECILHDVDDPSFWIELEGSCKV